MNLGSATAADGTITLFNATNAFSINIQAPTQTVGSATFTFPDTAGVNAEVCLDTGNCAGSGGGVTQSGSNANNQIAYFTSSNNITSTATFLFDGTGRLTLGDSSNQGSLRIYDGIANYGDIVMAALGQNTTYTLPDPGGATADICLSTGNCTGRSRWQRPQQRRLPDGWQ